MLPVSVKLIFLLHLISQAACSDSYSYHTSVKKLRKLAILDVNLFLEVEKISADIDDETFKENFLLWSEEVAKIRVDINEYIENPVNAFKLIKRNVIDIQLYLGKFHQLNVLNVSLNKIKVSLPTEDDLVGAAVGLARLQKFYKLRAHDLANGVINGVVTNSKLTSQDMVTISNQLKRLGPWENKLAREYHELSKNSSFVGSDDIFDENFLKNGKFSQEKDDILMQQSCRGEISKSPAEESELYCHYRSTNSFTKLAPFKIEVVNNDPLVFIIIDIIFDKEIEEIMKIYNNSETTKDSIVSTPTGNFVRLNYRVSSVDYFLESDHKIFKRITRRLDDVSDLNFRPEEPYQIFDYGIGGQFILHYDLPFKLARESGWDSPVRVVTILFYLSDVEQGGATVFPYIKTSIPVVKGTASFWFNVKDSGNDDYWTRHGGCPIIMGNKVVMKKWIFQDDQVLRRLCTFNDIKQNEDLMYEKFH